MTGRVYKVPFSNLTLGSSAKTDLWDVTCGSSVPIMLEEIRLDPIATAVSELGITVTRFTTFTAATGGTAIVPKTCNYGDVASSAAVIVMTTATMTATTTSTSVIVAPQIVDAGNWNLVNGWVWQPIDPDHRITVTAGGGIQVQMISTLASTLSLVSGCLTFREML